MKIFKFTSGGNPFPDVYYFNEVVTFSHSFDYDIFYKALLSENLILHSIGGSIYSYLIEEILSLKGTVGWPEYLNEVLGLHDLVEQWGWGDFFEGLQLYDSCIPRMVYSISLNENLAFVESGTYNLAKVDYKVTWRSRSKQPLVGYGKAGYGIEAGYGEGDCTDLKAFKIRVYTMPDHTLRRTATITIANTLNPDNNAEYIYTSAFNLSDNTTFKSNLRFEVTQVDQSDIESPVASIDIEPIPV
jgi:hypothetical protein